MSESTIAFDAQAVFALSSDRLYRVYVRDDALYFIRIGGQGVSPVLDSQFGLLGALVGQTLRKRSEAKREAKTAAQDLQDVQALLAQHKDNFRLVPADVIASSIEPPAGPAGHGPHWARWLLAWSDKKWTLQFEQQGDAETALAQLPRFFGDKLKVNVRWDEAKERYVRL